jgi:hypothetical protein
MFVQPWMHPAMKTPEIVRIASGVLNKVLFGARIAADRNVNSQLDTILVAYVANLFFVFLAVAVSFVVSGRYDPLHAPLEASALRTMLAIANPITLVLTFLASLSWVMHDEAVERALAAQRTTNPFYRALLLFFVPSLFINAAFCIVFFVAMFRFFRLDALLASVGCNCFLLLALFGRRSWKSRNRT